MTLMGTSVPEFYACRAGRTAIGPLAGVPLDELKITIAARVQEFDFAFDGFNAVLVFGQAPR